MPTKGLLSSTPEILIQILASCESFAQVVALSSTLQKPTPSLDIARATEIAKTAILNGKLPPKDINIAELSAAIRQLEVPEMAGIVSLQRLVESIKRFYLCGEALTWQYREDLGPPEFLPDPDEWERNCRAYFHRAVYRVLLSGSILAGWLMEPFSSEGVLNRLPSDFPPNLRLFLTNYPITEEDPWMEGLEERDIAYLERFIPFDQEANARVSEKQDALFGPMGRWLIQSMKKNVSHADLESVQYQCWMDKTNIAHDLNISGFQDGSIDEGKVILREVLRMLVAYENLTRALVNSGQKYGHGREWSEELYLPVILDNQKVFAIILGVYQLEQVEIAGEGWQPVKRVRCLPDGCSLGPVPEKAVDIFNLQEYLYRMSGRSNVVDDSKASPPRVQLFTFLLHRHFNLRFQQNYMWNHDKHESYLEFLADGAIFYNKPMMRGVVGSFNGPPVYSCWMQQF